MNAKGLTFLLSGVSAVLALPYYQSLVDNRTIALGELNGTRNYLSAVLATLKKTPAEKFEALTAQYDADLTAQFDTFTADKGDILKSFRGAQIMQGLVATVMAKAGLKII